MAKVLTFSALLAAVGMAVLPSGLLPKQAGPCGRELCYCEVMIDDRGPVPLVESSAALRLVEVSISSAGVPNAAFAMVFDGMLAPLPCALMLAQAAANEARPLDTFLARPDPSSEIVVPPPRA